MTHRLNQYQYVYHKPPPEIPPPLPMVCQRIATNVRGNPQYRNEPAENTAGAWIWTGADSGATGIHQNYEYEWETAYIEQQWLILSAVQGSDFIEGELLEFQAAP